MIRWITVLLLIVAGCDCSDPVVISPRIRVAQTEECGRPGLPSQLMDVQCIGFEIVDQAGERVPLGIGDRETENTSPVNADRLVVSKMGAGDFTLNARPTPGPVDVRVILFDQAGQPIGRGQRRVGSVAEFDGLQAQFFGRSNCAYAAGFEQAAPLPRALHQTVALPNGDVLILGGTSGSRNAEVMQRTVEVYRPGAGFIELGGDNFGRVGFTAVDVTAGSDPTAPNYVIHVSGGFDSTGSPLSVDGSLRTSGLGSPIALRAETVTAEDDLFLSYVPGRLTISRMSVPAQFVRGGSFNVASGTKAPALIVRGITQPSPAMVRDELAADAFWVGDQLMIDPLFTTETERFAPTVTLGDAGYLIYGGNVTATDPTQLAGTAMAFVAVPPERGTTVQSITVPTGFSTSPTLHSAVALGSEILSVGGLSITTGMDRPIQAGVKGLELINIDPALMTATSRDATGAYTPSFGTVAHTLGVRAVLTGGGVQTNDAGNLLITPSAQTVTVMSGGVGELAPGQQMQLARWGHSVARLYFRNRNLGSDQRLLVTGGFGPPPEYSAISAAEILDFNERSSMPTSAEWAAEVLSGVDTCLAGSGDGGT